MKRYLCRDRSGTYGWYPDKANPPYGARTVCEIVTPCPRCGTRGGVKVAGDGRASCANCGAGLPPK